MQRFPENWHRRVVRAEDLPDSGLLALVRTQPDVLGVIYERHAPVVYRYLGPAVCAAD